MKSMNRVLVTVLFLMCLGALTACKIAEHKLGLAPTQADALPSGEDTNNSGNDTGLVCVPEVNYKMIQETLVQPKCLKCHSAGSGLLSLETYSDLKSNIDLIETVVQEGSMPPGRPLDAVAKDMILSWIKAGAPETVADALCTDEVTLSLDPSFESINEKILEPRCVLCHDFTNSYDFSSFDKITELKALFDSKPGEDPRFVKSLTSGRMPPGPEKLTSLEIETIRKWIALGLPEKDSGSSVSLNIIKQ